MTDRRFFKVPRITAVCFLLYSEFRGRVKHRDIDTCIIPPLKHSSNILHDGTTCLLQVDLKTFIPKREFHSNKKTG